MNTLSIYSEINILDYVLILLYVLYILKQFSVYTKIDRKIGVFSLVMGLLHFIITFASYGFILGSVADAKHYYSESMSITDWGLSYLSNGTSFIIFLNYMLVQWFHLSFLGCFLVFSFISYLGCLKLFEVIIDLTDRNYNISYLLLLLIGTHFWTVSLGKDSLMFYSMCCLCYNIYFDKPKSHYILPLLLIGLIRLHVLIFVLVGGGVSYVFTNKKIKMQTKFIFVGLVLGALLVLIPFFLKEIAVTNFSDIEGKLQNSMNANLEGGAGVDMKDSNLIVKWFSYMFRPFIFEARNPMFLVSALENLVWLYIFFIIIKGLFFDKIKTNYILWSYIGIILACTLPLAYTLANFGISMRQKIMIFPFFLILFFIVKNHRKSFYENSISDQIHQ
jgi:putative membrane protein